MIIESGTCSRHAGGGGMCRGRKNTSIKIARDHRNALVHGTVRARLSRTSALVRQVSPFSLSLSSFALPTMKHNVLRIKSIALLDAAHTKY